MSTTEQMPGKYRPTERLIDNRRRLKSLYVEQGYSIREIADDHADVSHTAVYRALCDHNIIEASERHSTDGRDPPSEETAVDWSVYTE